MIRHISSTSQFDRALKKLAKKHFSVQKINTVIDLIVAEDTDTLDRQYFRHMLKGNRAGIFDVHITKNWLLIYEIIEDEATLILLNTGNHTIINK